MVTHHWVWRLRDTTRNWSNYSSATAQKNIGRPTMPFYLTPEQDDFNKIELQVTMLD
jgi:hypothetical protein